MTWLISAAHFISKQAMLVALGNGIIRYVIPPAAWIAVAYTILRLLRRREDVK